MQRYFVRGTRSDGSTTVERVSAPSASAALDGCRARGFTDVELVMDEILAGSRTAEFEQSVTAENEVDILFGGPWATFWIAFRSGWLLWVPAIVVIVYQVWHGSVGFLSLIAIAAIGLCLMMARGAAFASEPYNDLLRAIARGRWNEALQLLEPLESSPQMAEANAASELGFRRAQILIGLGRTEEARAAAEKACADPSQPGWSSQLRMTDFHIAMGDSTAAEAGFLEAIKLMPQNAVPHLAYAEFQAGHLKRDPRGARTSLETARHHLVAPTLRWAELKIEGLIYVEEGAFQLAHDKLEKARIELEKFPDPGTRHVADAYIAAYSCLALCGLGERERAAKLFTEIEPWLKPHQLDELIARCRSAIGTT